MKHTQLIIVFKKKKIMRTKIIGLTVFGVVFFLFSCQSTKINTGENQKPFSDTLQDSSHLAFYKGDTISYVNYIVKNQAKYIGKPLSDLLKDLEIPIHTFSYSPNQKDRYKITNLTLSTKQYNTPPRIINGYDQEIEIGIGWQTFVSPDSIKAIKKENGPPDYYNWSEKAKGYFGKQIVGNLWLSGYLKR